MIWQGDDNKNYLYFYRDGEFVKKKCGKKMTSSVVPADKAVVTTVPWSCFHGTGQVTFKAFADASVAATPPKDTKLYPVAGDRTRATQVTIR